MSEPELLRRSRAVLQRLTQMAAERARAEADVERTHAAATAAARKEFDKAQAAVSARHEEERTAAEEAFTLARQVIPEETNAEYEAVEREFFTARRKTSKDYGSARDALREEVQEGRWTIRTMYEAAKRELKVQMQATHKRNRDLIGCGRRLKGLHAQAVEHLAACRQGSLAELPLPEPAADGGGDPFARVTDCETAATEALEAMRGLSAPRWYRGARLGALFVGLSLLALPVAYFASGRHVLTAAGFAAACALILGSLAAGGLYFLARGQLRRLFEEVGQAVADGTAAVRRCRDVVAAEYQQLVARRGVLRDKKNADLAQATQRARVRLAELDGTRSAESRRIEAHYPPRLAAIRTRRDGALREVTATYQRALAASNDRYLVDSQQAEETFRRKTVDSDFCRDQAWNALAEAWRKGMADTVAEVDELNGRSAVLFPPWDEVARPDRPLPAVVPPGLRFGETLVRLAEIPQGIPQDPRLRDGLPENLQLPALLPFPNRASLLVKAGEGGRGAAVDVLQAVMARFLTSVPPGKVRFTILDPVGLGENFAAFMHLADYDEALVASRIWTEQQHIEQRLADLTAHMENVIQKYLRNQFQTLEEYNAQAGEVAEPFRVLVVADFPANFTVEAARRLSSITLSGARCGVYTLMSVDPKQAMPEGFSLKELEPACTTLVWKDNRFVWKDPDFERHALRVDAPPAAEQATPLLHRFGEAAREVKRVEVPFEAVAPLPEAYWSRSSTHGIDVPLGRAGATRLQHLKLGQGTSQHVLIAGKTGSGKSTLLHALVTNLALLYGPDEVELYLVDFKKGVEFKTYATEGLPHARVVAIESEREFGLSVLQRLDGELKQRGDLFRAAGVQDLAGYRQAVAAATSNGAARPAPCPRILLIVDEFQEFFVEDDRIAQEAALLLDRLVRQGRAFGIHIHLGSQTLSGAYTLARSTIDQMAVRIALQCSETDAYLILSKDNAAARLLSRPGEAIYNDANGLLEGNDIFQIVWLSDERREEYLKRIRRLADARGYVPPQPTIVFEGNIPAVLARNDALRRLIAAPAWPPPPRKVRAWLGEAIAIKDPTAADFQAQTGSNLLVVGPQEELALGLVTGAVFSLAAQQAPAVGDEPATARFVVLDGTPVDSPHVGWLETALRALPHPCRVAGWRDTAAVLGELAAEVDRRLKAPQVVYPSVYLVLFGLQRFRDLRKGDDDFGFSRRGEEKATPAQQLATVLREGPGLGVHVLAWCDTLNNLNRAFDRGTLREFEMRVLFQMNAGDSSTLIDNPGAAKLGIHRALYHSEDRGEPEKFRPYGLPGQEWLEEVKQRLAGRKPARERAAAVAGAGAAGSGGPDGAPGH